MIGKNLKNLKKMISNKIKKILIDKKNHTHKYKILCIGDIVLDHYIYGKVERMSPEAPIPILLPTHEKYLLGGAGNVAKNISDLGGKVSLLYLSSSENLSKIIKNLINENKNISSLSTYNKKFKTPIKTRYINNSNHMIRVDYEDAKFKLDQKTKKIILGKIEKKILKHDVVVLSDYDKGLLDKQLIKKIIKISNDNNKIIIADPKKNDFACYSNISLLTPNQKEITDAAKKTFLSEKELLTFSNKLIMTYKIKNILITRSEKGMILVNSKSVEKIKACTKVVSDVTGAGDTVIGTIALMIAMGFDIKIASIISNYAASIVVGKQGTATINFKELIR